MEYPHTIHPPSEERERVPHMTREEREQMYANLVRLVGRGQHHLEAEEAGAEDPDCTT